VPHTRGIGYLGFGFAKIASDAPLAVDTEDESIEVAGPLTENRSCCEFDVAENAAVFVDEYWFVVMGNFSTIFGSAVEKTRGATRSGVGRGKGRSRKGNTLASLADALAASLAACGAQ
jgi:hypothetical protein